MSSRRAYRSELREERARETRRRIRGSARELFVERGFSQTTVAAIAERAGVSSQTVYATFGSKSAIVAALVDGMEEGADTAGWAERIRAEADPYRRLRLFASLNRAMFEGAADLLRIALMTRGDPDVRELAARGDERRRVATRGICEGLAASGVMREGLSPSAAAEQLWLLTSAEQYLLATGSLGWSPDTYETWLGDLLELLLLAPRGG